MYDVHSPAVPPVDVLRSKIKQFVDTGVLAGHPDRLWVNPDCGLKTRDWVEVCSSCITPLTSQNPVLRLQWHDTTDGCHVRALHHVINFLLQQLM